MEGYIHPLYAASLGQFGEPIELMESGGWLLRREIAGSALKDAIGSYPLFCCKDWTKLESDLNGLRNAVITVSLVVDPFAPVSERELTGCFQVVKPFKEHYIVETALPTNQHVNKHHRYYARKALEEIKVEIAGDPSIFLDEWCLLYETLIQRHQLKGIKAFSKSSFEILFKVPGLVMFRAVRNGKSIGAHLWFVQGEVAYSHLSAFNEEGYSFGAAYALYWTAIQTFKEQYVGKVLWLDLGAGAGIGKDAKDGLSQFKSRWASGVKTKYFCGKIFDLDAYRHLSEKLSTRNEGYFPVYRSGELT